MHDPATSSTLDLVQVAYDFGPFLFAILFVTSLTLLAQRAYLQEKDPEHAKTLRITFFASFIFGLVLVTTCVSWWIYDRISAKSYVYNVHIRGFDKVSGTLVARNAYTQGEMLNDVQPVVNLVIVQKQPMPSGQSIQIALYPPESGGVDSDVKTITVPINGYDNDFLYHPSNNTIDKD